MTSKIDIRILNRHMFIIRFVDLKYRVIQNSRNSGYRHFHSRGNGQRTTSLAAVLLRGTGELGHISWTCAYDRHKK